MLIHPVKNIQIFLLIIKKAIIPKKYLDFFNMFLEKKALVLPKITELNQYFIKLKEDK